MKCSNCNNEAVPSFKKCEQCREKCRRSARKSRQNRLEFCRERNARWGRARYAKLKADTFTLLGGRCNNSRCRWLNEDGTLGCKDWEILQIDHINGGGVKEHSTLSSCTFLKKVLADTTGIYQLLCPNCNWKKRAERKEQPNRGVSRIAA